MSVSSLSTEDAHVAANCNSARSGSWVNDIGLPRQKYAEPGLPQYACDLLTDSDREELRACEDVVAKSLATFVDVGNALFTIKQRRLYRENYKGFEDYCVKRWGFKRSHGYRLIDAASVTNQIKALPNAPERLPESESVARTMVGLLREDLDTVWTGVCEACAGRRITAAYVRQRVKNIRIARAAASGTNEFSTSVAPSPQKRPTITKDILRKWNRTLVYAARAAENRNYQVVLKLIREVRDDLGIIVDHPGSFRYIEGEPAPEYVI